MKKAVSVQAILYAAAIIAGLVVVFMRPVAVDAAKCDAAYEERMADEQADVSQGANDDVLMFASCFGLF